MVLIEITTICHKVRIVNAAGDFGLLSGNHQIWNGQIGQNLLDGPGSAPGTQYERSGLPAIQPFGYGFLEAVIISVKHRELTVLDAHVIYRTDHSTTLFHLIKIGDDLFLIRNGNI